MASFRTDKNKQDSFIPGVLWTDNNGQPINAHGGGVICVNGVYYWYGEHKLPGRSEAEFADGGVHCYSSKDLYNWEDRGLVLSVDYQDEKSDIASGCILERPKVLYNERTKKYVMYFKLYPKGTGYDTGYVGVAVSDSPTGNFVYSHKFLGAGSEKGSGDFCMFKDADGQVYHFTVRKPDKAFCAGKLTDDYLYPAGEYKVLEGISLHTEAPAVILHNNKYFLVGSGSSGWKPNTARSFVSDSAIGDYTELGNPCTGINPHNQMNEEKTFGGQISYIIPVEGNKDDFIAMFDIWKPEAPIESLYIWLPLKLDNNKLTIEWHDKWNLSALPD
ncbi:family 43 glycosylhydrolase [Proteiniphilum sp.]|uniref:family 43 glycosylhydrolase n=1 Tax=Proteiniphilum sp. TaxID=1926877 RepID=UPI003A520BD6